jgi:hypothetical protein
LEAVLEVAKQVGEKLLEMAAEHPEAVAQLAQAVANVASSKDPLETAKRAAMATASAEASEEALKRILGRG